MDIKEQKKFVRGMSQAIVKGILKDMTRIPGNWDGHELRALLAERHAESARMSVIRKRPHNRRARNYRNTKLIEGL